METVRSVLRQQHSLGIHVRSRTIFARAQPDGKEFRAEKILMSVPVTRAKMVVNAPNLWVALEQIAFVASWVLSPAKKMGVYLVSPNIIG